jgi:GxxExxY protein
VELKVVDGFAELHKAQLLSYLKTTQLVLGLLINFKVPRLVDGVHRAVLNPPQQR